jgi:unsaturated rhamnogalacturonyl hydrolase
MRTCKTSLDKPPGFGLQNTVHKSLFSLAALALGCVVIAGCASTAEKTSALDCFQNWPTNCDPKIVGTKVTENLLARKIYCNAEGYIVYPEVCAAFGALRFTAAAHEGELEQKLIDRYAFILTPEGSKLVSTNRHVDFHVFGALPLEIYLLNGDKHYRDFGLRMADDQWVDSLPDGTAHESRYWVDDCFMIGALQIQAYRATHDPKYADHAAVELAAYLDKLQQPNGLFFHADISHHYWGRGNGWFAVALAEVLSSLPPDHPQYARLMLGYRQMMAALKLYQSPSGLWRQLVDNDKAWDETSCAGMFTFALALGVKHGWLDEAEYGPVARNGWIGLCGEINPDGNVRDVCIGTNQKDDTQYYLNRPRAVGDLHGQAPILWCAWALLGK